MFELTYSLSRLKKSTNAGSLFSPIRIPSASSTALDTNGKHAAMDDDCIPREIFTASYAVNSLVRYASICRPNISFAVKPSSRIFLRTAFLLSALPFSSYAVMIKVVSNSTSLSFCNLTSKAESVSTCVVLSMILLALPFACVDSSIIAVSILFSALDFSTGLSFMTTFVFGISNSSSPQALGTFKGYPVTTKWESCRSS